MSFLKKFGKPSPNDSQISSADDEKLLQFLDTEESEKQPPEDEQPVVLTDDAAPAPDGGSSLDDDLPGLSASGSVLDDDLPLKQHAGNAPDAEPNSDVSGADDAADAEIPEVPDADITAIPDPDAFAAGGTDTDSDTSAEHTAAWAEGDSRNDAAPDTRARVLRGVRIGVLSLCGVVFVACLVLIVINLYGKYRGSQIYDPGEIDDILGNDKKGGISSLDKNPAAIGVNDLTVIENGGDVIITLPPETTPPEQQPDDTATKIQQMRDMILRYQTQNADIFGYIYIAGTNIRYPLVKGSDNDFYLRHDAYTKESISVGAIFMDYRQNNVLSGNMNTVLYGHNMDDGSMFHDVTKYASSTFFRSTPVYIYTVEGLYVYTPFCYYKPHKGDQYIRDDFDSGDSFAAFAQALQGKSYTSSNHVFTGDDRIITLSTCLNGTTTSPYRYVLHAYLSEFIPYTAQ